MCKEDIRLARAAQPKSALSQAATTIGVKYLGADAERYALSASLNSTISVAGDECVLIYAQSGSSIFPLISLSRDHAQGSVSLEDIGNVICYDIFVKSLVVATLPTVAVADSCFLTPMKDI